MENLLLILDEIDDAVAVLRALLPRLLGFLLASGLFALNIVLAMYWPTTAGIALTLVLLCASPAMLRSAPAVRFKTDP